MRKLGVLLLLVLFVAVGFVFVACDPPDDGNITVTWQNWDGSKIRDEKLPKDTVLTAPAGDNIPTRESYDFTGWVTLEGDYYNFADEKPLTEDVTLQASFKPTEYKIEYASGDGLAFLSANPTKYTVESDITLKDAESRGYAFTGWYTAASGGSKVTKVSGMSGDLKFFARFNVAHKSIIYKYQVLGMENAATLNAGNFGLTTDYALTNSAVALTALNDEDIAGYKFLGWMVDGGDGTVVTEIDGTAYQNGITLVAKLETITYTITYKNVNGSVDNSTNPATYTVEDAITLVAPTFTPGALTFVEWQKDGVTFDGVIAVGSTGDIEITAVWDDTELTALTYEITVDPAVDDEDNPISMTYPDIPASITAVDQDIVLETDLKDGYSAVWQFYDESATDWVALADNTILSTITADIKVRAVLTVIDYTITYDYDGGVADASTYVATYTVNDSVNLLLNAPTRDGATFDCWLLEDEETTGITVGTTGNKTFVARWNFISYNIDYAVASIDNDGGKYSDADVDYATAKDKTTYIVTDGEYNPAATLTGYELTGWEYSLDGGTNWVADVDFDTITGNVLLRPVFEIITYTVTYNFDGGAEDGVSTYAADYTILTPEFVVPVPAARAGYIFDGYTFNNARGANLSKNDNEEFVILAEGHEDIAIFANWLLDELTITYLYDKAQGITGNHTYEDITEMQGYTTYTVSSGSWTLGAAPLRGHSQTWEISPGATDLQDANNSDTWTWTTVSTIAFADYSEGIYLRPVYSPTAYIISFAPFDGVSAPSSTAYPRTYIYGVAKDEPWVEYANTDNGNLYKNRYSFIGYYLEINGIQTDRAFNGYESGHDNIGRLTLYPVFELRSYNISYQDGDGAVIVPLGAPKSYTWDTIESKTFPTMPSVRSGEYTDTSLSGAFKGWEIVSGAVAGAGGTINGTEITTGEIKDYVGIGYAYSTEAENRVAGNLVVRVVYRPYAVAYSGAVADNGNPETYLYESDITLADPAASQKIGYTFKEWQLDGVKIEKIFEMERDITLTAIWDINTYQIETVYDTDITIGFGLTKGDITPASDMKVSYTVEDEDYLMPNAYLVGHGATASLNGSAWEMSFGDAEEANKNLWTWTAVANNTLVFDSGITGKIYLRPVFVEREYQITYVDVASGNASNVTMFKYDTADITLADPTTKPGYEFVQWRFENLSGAILTKIVAKDYLTDITVVAEWKVLKLTVSLDTVAAVPDVGTDFVSGLTFADVTIPASVSALSTYTVEDVAVTLEDATLLGHGKTATADGTQWQVSVDGGTTWTDLADNNLNFASYPNGNLKLRAKFTPRRYSVTLPEPDLKLGITGFVSSWQRDYTFGSVKSVPEIVYISDIGYTNRNRHTAKFTYMSNGAEVEFAGFADGHKNVGDITLALSFVAREYTISYLDKDGAPITNAEERGLPTVYTWDTANETAVAPFESGIEVGTFEWQLGGTVITNIGEIKTKVGYGDSTEDNTTVSPTIGNVTLQTVYTGNYTVAYNNAPNGAGNNPAFYNSYFSDGDEDIVIDLAAPAGRDGMTFVEWRLADADGDAVTQLTVQKTDMKNITLWAVWDLIDYAVTVVYPADEEIFDGGLTGADIGNKTVTVSSYTVETADLTLDLPTLTGYDVKWQFSTDGETWTDVPDGILVFADYLADITIKPIFTPTV